MESYGHNFLIPPIHSRDLRSQETESPFSILGWKNTKLGQRNVDRLNTMPCEGRGHASKYTDKEEKVRLPNQHWVSKG